MDFIGRSFLILMSMMLLVVGCQSKKQINYDKLVILKRLGTENNHGNYKEITNKGTILTVKSLLKKRAGKKLSIACLDLQIISFISYL